MLLREENWPRKTCLLEAVPPGSPRLPWYRANMYRGHLQPSTGLKAAWEKERKATYFVSVENPCRKHRSWQISQISLFLSGHRKVVRLSAKIKQFDVNSLLLMLLWVGFVFVSDVQAGIWKLIYPCNWGKGESEFFIMTQTCTRYPLPLGYPACNAMCHCRFVLRPHLR